MLREELDPQAILQSLGLTDVTAIIPVLEGSDNAIWRVECAGTVYALRVSQQGFHAISHGEVLVMRAALDAGLPVPQVHAESDWQGYPVLLLSWMPGRTVAHELLSRPWRVWKVGRAFGQVFADLHAVPAPAFLSQQPETWIDWAGFDELSWRERLRTASQHATTLLHLDYHPLNVMTDGNTITGVLDWRNALVGDPRADIARTVTILRVESTGRLKVLETLLRRIFELAWRTGYYQQRGSPGEMSLFYAWAGAMMERDLAGKRRPEELARIHRWTLRWQKRAAQKSV